MSRRRPSIRQLLLASLILALLGGGGLFFLASSRPALSFSLKSLDALLAQQRFAEVEQRLLAFLRDRPDDPRANVLMAQVALARPDQKPELALRHLGRVRLTDRGALAIVRLNEGKAYSALGRFPEAERSWLDALRIDPAVPEAGWALLGLYYVQGRRDEAHDLAMKLRESEPDRRDRAQLLLELLRQDAKSLVYETLVPVLRPLVRDHPDDVHSAIALARALIRTSGAEEGLDLLRRLIEHSPESALVWDAWLSGLDESFRYDELDRELTRLPRSLAAAGRFERYRGAVAQDRQNWSEAASAYRRALKSEPFDGQLLYRLCQTLRAGGQPLEASVVEPERRAIEAARQSALGLYEEANAVSSLGMTPHTSLYLRLADLREKMGRPDEAMAWHKLILVDEPNNLISQTALDRLAAKNALLGSLRAPFVPRP